MRHSYNSKKRLALYLKEKTEDNAIIIAMDDIPFIEYYGNRKGIPHPIGDSAKTDAFIKEISRYLKSGIAVYIIQSAFQYGDRYLERKLLDNFNGRIIGEKSCEDYHVAEVVSNTYQEKIYKIMLKRPSK